MGFGMTFSGLDWGSEDHFGVRIWSSDWGFGIVRLRFKIWVQSYQVEVPIGGSELPIAIRIGIQGCQLGFQKIISQFV